MDLSDLQLETPRLLLRLPRRDDYEAWAAFGADEEATRFIGGMQARSPAWHSARCFRLERGTFQFQGGGMVGHLAARGMVPVEWYRLDRKTWLSLKSWGDMR